MVSNELGGKRHIEGVILGFSSHFETTFISDDSAMLDAQCKCIEVSRSFYYFQIAALLFRSSFDVVNFRKTLIGMYICMWPILLMKIFGDRTTYILEFNGISGDFRVSNKILKRLFLYLNALPLLVYDKAYCVNDNIANRLASVFFVTESKLYVCPNGCFITGNNHTKRKKQNQIELVFYGSDQAKYHIEWILQSVKHCNYVTKIHLFGHGLDRYLKYSKVECYGATKPSKFVTKLNELLDSGINLYGIIPLDVLPAGFDIIPIKAMDYLSVPIPIISSNACLSQADFDGVRFSYIVGDSDSLLNTIKYVALEGEYSEIYWERTLSVVAQKFSWQETLKPLVSSIE